MQLRRQRLSEPLERDRGVDDGLQAEMRAGAAEVALAESEIGDLHVGLNGTTGALRLKDLADKTRRGLESRGRQACSGGGLCYDYRLARGPAWRSGKPERGMREIDPAEAAVVRRIVDRFAARRGRTRASCGSRRGLGTASWNSEYWARSAVS